MRWLALVALLAAAPAFAKGKAKAALTSIANAGELAQQGKLLYAVLDTDLGTITIELDPKIAPQSVGAFVVAAAGKGGVGVYDGTVFHRTIPGFLIEGGDAKGTGAGPPAFNVPDESTLPAQQAPHFVTGAVGLAKPPGLATSGSRFFILLGDAPWLEGRFVRIGQVITGMDVANAIAAAPRGPMDRPLTPVAIHTMRILDRPPG